MTPNELAIIEILKEIFRSKDLPVPEIVPGTVLDSTLGLESLDIAELVVRLEENTGKDPFAQGMETQIQTVSDLARLYDARG